MQNQMSIFGNLSRREIDDLFTPASTAKNLGVRPEPREKTALYKKAVNTPGDGLHCSVSAVSTQPTNTDTSNVIFLADFRPRQQQTFKRQNHVRNEKHGVGVQTAEPLFTQSEIIEMGRALYAEKDPRYFVAFVLGVNVGLRIGDLLQLRMKHVYRKDGSVRINADLYDTSDGFYVKEQKTGKDRMIFLNDACKRVLEWYKGRGCVWYDEEEFLFNSSFSSASDRRAIKDDTVRKHIKRAAEKCGITRNIATHTLRKTWVVWGMIANQDKRRYSGATLYQFLLGHASMDSTMHYIGLTQIDAKRANHNSIIDVLGAVQGKVPYVAYDAKGRSLPQDIRDSLDMYGIDDIGTQKWTE